MIRYFLIVLVALAAMNVPADDAAPGLYTSPSLAKDSRFFEMRTYHAAQGKLAALHERFRNFTNKLFVKHGMDLVGYWVPMDKEGKYENTLVYILAFPSHEARDKAWKEFTADPDWVTVKNDSEKNGKLVEKVDSQYMTATDYSPIR
jgi:hypothetical protein